MRDLADYLDDVASRRWEPGALDCCTFMADWLVRLGLPDPMADRRGTYATEREYRKALRGEGGLVKSCASRFATIGLRKAREAKPGDVALVWTPFAKRHGRLLYRPGGAIAATARHLAFLTREGVSIVDRGLLKASLCWSVPHA